MGRQTKARTIKCRFCDWEIPAFRRRKDGTVINNYSRLVEHCIMHHEEEVKSIGLLMYEKPDERRWEMDVIEARVCASSDVSGDPLDHGRITFIPSGFEGNWIAVIEDVDYSLSVRYLRSDEVEDFNLNSKGGNL